MATIVHKLKSLAENTKSFPPYKWEATCECGWATKNPTKELAQSQFDAHLQYNGVNVEVKPPEPEVKDGKLVGTWVPAGARQVDSKSKVEQPENNKPELKKENPTPAIKPLGK